VVQWAIRWSNQDPTTGATIGAATAFPVPPRRISTRSERSGAIATRLLRQKILSRAARLDTGKVAAPAAGTTRRLAP